MVITSDLFCQYNTKISYIRNGKNVLDDFNLFY